MSFLDRAARRRGEIPVPTVAQAVAHLIHVVAQFDNEGRKSPTIEAIRVLLTPPETPQ